MKIIAFKRSNIPSLHPLFITEYVDEKHLSSTEGYELLAEEDFLKELALNEKRHEEHLKELRKQELLSIKSQEAALIKEKAVERELSREFDEFLAYRKHKKGKKNV